MKEAAELAGSLLLLIVYWAFRVTWGIIKIVVFLAILWGLVKSLSNISARKKEGQVCYCYIDWLECHNDRPPRHYCNSLVSGITLAKHRLIPCSVRENAHFFCYRLELTPVLPPCSRHNLAGGLTCTQAGLFFLRLWIK